MHETSGESNTKSTSLTNQLLDVLNFEEESESNHDSDRNIISKANQSPNNKVGTAARELIKARKESQAQLNDIVPITLPNKKTNVTTINPFLQQISTSTTEPPTYWKTTNDNYNNNNNNNHVSNAKKKKQDRGEQYNDRLNQKFASKKHRAQRLNNMKNIY